MKPYIRLSISEFAEHNNMPNAKPSVPKTDFSKTNLNKITYAQLIEFGFDEKICWQFYWI